MEKVYLSAAESGDWMSHEVTCKNRRFGSEHGECDCIAKDNPALATVLEHLDVFEVLAPRLTAEGRLEHAQRIVDAVLGLNGAKVIR